MATILPFVVRPRSAAPASDRLDRGVIIIFPGVRYEKARNVPERDDHDDQPATADGGRRKGKRKAR